VTIRNATRRWPGRRSHSRSDTSCLWSTFYSRCHRAISNLSSSGHERGNRARADRLEARNGCEINRKAEEEVRAVLEHLSAQDEALAKIVETLAAQSLNGNGGAAR